MLYSEVEFPVRYYETDQMGIVHHSNYIRYFETCRSKMMAENGYPVERCEEEGTLFPIVSIECRYLYPARMGDVLTVSAKVEKKPMAKFTFEQEVRNQRGEVCARGTVVVGFLDKKTGCPCRCPEGLASLFEE